MILSCLQDYGDKRAWNKRIGPGGGTRRLHHKIYGAEIGSTNVKRCLLLLGGMATDIGAKRIVANDNYAPVAVAA